MSHGYGQGYMDHRRVVWITALLVSLASIARADDTGDTPCTIPMRVDWSSWLRAGGGVTVAHPTREAARATGTSSSGVFDLGLGFEGMIAVGGKRVRLGPWGQVSTWSFRNVAPVGGVELMLSSPLCDEKAFVSDLEQAYRQMWMDWCNRRLAEKTSSVPGAA